MYVSMSGGMIAVVLLAVLAAFERFLAAPVPPQTAPDAKTWDVTRITDRLFLGSHEMAQSKEWLDAHGIHDVVSFCGVESINPAHTGVKIRYYSMYDADTPSDTHSMRHALCDGLWFLEQQTIRGRPTLVHCKQGISRSATLIVAYIMKHRRMNLATALSTLQAQRPAVQPNNGFMRELIRLEMELYGTTSLDESDYAPPILL